MKQSSSKYSKSLLTWIILAELLGCLAVGAWWYWLEFGSF